MKVQYRAYLVSEDGDPVFPGFVTTDPGTTLRFSCLADSPEDALADLHLIVLGAEKEWQSLRDRISEAFHR